MYFKLLMKTSHEEEDQTFTPRKHICTMKKRLFTYQYFLTQYAFKAISLTLWRETCRGVRSWSCLNNSILLQFLTKFLTKIIPSWCFPSPEDEQTISQSTSVSNTHLSSSTYIPVGIMVSWLCQYHPPPQLYSDLAEVQIQEQFKPIEIRGSQGSWCQPDLSNVDLQEIRILLSFRVILKFITV